MLNPFPELKVTLSLPDLYLNPSHSSTPTHFSLIQLKDTPVSPLNLRLPMDHYILLVIYVIVLLKRYYLLLGESQSQISIIS